jgi:predicted nuclease of restriction endonuclease-like RecB superfamily
MNPVIHQKPIQNETGASFWDQFSHLPGTIESRIPTFDKSLDAYFDQNFAAIIEEWDLVTDSDLHKLENRLESVSDEISSLYAGKMSIEGRAKKLDIMISSLEKSL